MNIITLTTDMGLNDHYVASLKGAILAMSKDVHLIDISHNVKPFNIAQASLFIKSCMSDFEDGTVHLIGVDSEPIINFGDNDAGSLPSFMLYKNQYFVATDNGIFSLILGQNKPDKIWTIDDVLSNPNLMKFPTKNILAPAACALINKVDPDSIGSRKEAVKRAFVANPVIESNVLKGNVIHIDHYGNLITNISLAEFQRMGRNVPFTIYFRKKEYYIDEISAGYNEVPAGERVALFNDNNLLEIAINKGTPSNGGGANSLFGLFVGDVIRIEFTPRGSKTTLESLF
jgi:hypothetical protein